MFFNDINRNLIVNVGNFTLLAVMVYTNILCHIEVHISKKYGAGITKCAILSTFRAKHPPPSRGLAFN